MQNLLKHMMAMPEDDSARLEFENLLDVVQEVVEDARNWFDGCGCCSKGNFGQEAEVIWLKRMLQEASDAAE